MKTFAEILQALADAGDIASLDAETLAEYRTVLRDGVVERAELEDITPEVLAEIRAGKEAIDSIDARSAEAEAINTELDEIVSGLKPEDEAKEGETEEPEASAELADETEDETEEVTAAAEAEVAEDEEKEAVTAAAPAPVRRRPRGAAELDAVAPETPAGDSGARSRRRFTAAAGVNGFRAGEEFEDVVDLSKALLNRFDDIRGGGTEKLAVANLKGAFTDEMTLVAGDTEGNITRLGGSDPTHPDAIAASLACTPREPLYDVGIDSSTARPVLASLPRRRAPRGGYTVYPSPLLADIEDAAGSGDGTGVWTGEEDDDPEAVKNACAVITCSTPVQYDIYGVYRCMTVRNLLNMTFPELVEAYLNKLTALWARLAEITLLDAMVGSVNTTAITAAAQDLSANQNLIEIINRAAMVYREQERYGGIMLDAWLPRWVLGVLISDHALLTRYDSNLADRVATEADVARIFSDLGVRAHFTLDSATGWQVITAQSAGALQSFPTTIDMILSPRGNFQALDQGTLQVGVTNRTPWDLDDMARNQFTMFWESFEGLLDMGAQTWTLRITSLDPNGKQLGNGTVS